VKAPQYVAMSNLSTNDTQGMNYKNMLQIIMINETSEFLNYYSQFRNLYDVINKHYTKLVESIKTFYLRALSNINSKNNKNVSKEELLNELRNVIPKDLQAIWLNDYVNIIYLVYNSTYSDIEDSIANYNLDIIIRMAKNFSTEQDIGILRTYKKKKRNIKRKRKRKKYSLYLLDL